MYSSRYSIIIDYFTFGENHDLNAWIRTRCAKFLRCSIKQSNENRCNLMVVQTIFILMGCIALLAPLNNDPAAIHLLAS